MNSQKKKEEHPLKILLKSKERMNYWMHQFHFRIKKKNPTILYKRWDNESGSVVLIGGWISASFN